MEIEFNTHKREATLKDRGIDFANFSRMFTGVVVRFAARQKPGEEKRMAAVGMLDAKIVTAIYTMRGKNCRILSFRRAHDNEEKIYKNAAENVKKTTKNLR
jgi:hypothetical protein